MSATRCRFPLCIFQLSGKLKIHSRDSWDTVSCSWAKLTRACPRQRLTGPTLGCTAHCPLSLHHRNNGVFIFVWLSSPNHSDLNKWFNKRFRESSLLASRPMHRPTNYLRVFFIVRTAATAKSLHLVWTLYCNARRTYNKHFRSKSQKDPKTYPLRKHYRERQTKAI